MVFGQLVERRREFYLVPWGVGLAIFAFVFAFEFTTLSRIAAPGEGLSRTYLAMYPILVAVLGLGTVYLAADRRWGHGFLVYVLVSAGTLLYFIATAPVDSVPLWLSWGLAWVLGIAAMPDSVGLLSLLLLSSGAVALVGGALYSWYKTRWGYNLLIAAGVGLMVAAGFLARSIPWDYRLIVFYAVLILGLVVMSDGFLRSRRIAQAARAQTVTAPVE